MDLSKAGVRSAGESEEMEAPEFTVHWAIGVLHIPSLALGKGQERVWEAESIEML